MASPADYSPTGWWKADSESFADGAEADPIHDRSGNARDLTAGGGAGTRPIMKTGIVNGLSVFRFDGNDQTTSSAVLSALLTAAAGTVYAFCRPKTISGTGTSSSAQFNHVVRSSSGVFFGIGFRDNAGAKVAGASNFDGTADEAPEKTIAGLDRWYLLLWMHSAGSVFLGVDDLTSAALSSTASGDTSDLTSGLQLSGNNQNFDGDVAEVCTFNTAHDEATRTSLQQYFNFKYRVSSLLEAQRALASRHLRLVSRPIPLVHCRRRSLIVVPDLATALRRAA